MPKQEPPKVSMEDIMRAMLRESELNGGVPRDDSQDDDRPRREEAPRLAPPPVPVYDGKLHPEAWDRVCLPDETKQEIMSALHQYTHGAKLFNEWGLGKTITYGRGCGMLAYGPPGCGKTLLAKATAEYLGAPLIEKDSATIESCVPGQAERNVSAAFKEALDKKAVLFFDECDTLLASRNSAHMMQWMTGIINALLTNIEKYEGIVIFATNRLSALDPAVNRRLSCKVEIPYPDERTRQKIWEVHLPKELPLAKDVNLRKLACVPLSGGEIKNAVLLAARTASMNEEKKVSAKYFVYAAKKQIASRDAFNQKKDYLVA